MTVEKGEQKKIAKKKIKQKQQEKEMFEKKIKIYTEKKLFYINFSKKNNFKY